tara:strand:+ start:111 stop:575 length:465 start_codon:yes stop_codon:yes gene_type:complete
MNEVCNIEIFPFDYEKLHHAAVDNIDGAKPYYHHGDHLIDGMFTCKYLNRSVVDLAAELGIKGKFNAKFVYINPNTVIPKHRDWGTKCAFMWVLNGNEASIEFDSGFYKYKAALVDVSKEHGVTNTGTTRILFKISVFDMEYEEVCNNLITRFS